MKYDVLSLGPARMDVFLGFAEADVVEMCSIDRKRSVIELGYGEKIPIESIGFSVGGNSGNNAVGLARLGFKTAMVGALGDQPTDDQVIQVLREEGVGTKYLQRKPGLGGYGVIINYQAERTILSYYGDPPADFLSDDEDVQADWVYLTTAGGNYEEFYHKAVDWAVKKQVKIAFNPGTRQVKAGAALKYVYEKTDLLFVNREEAQVILGLNSNDQIPNPKDLLNGLHNWGCKIVVITDGPNGTYCFDGSSYLFMPIVPAPVVERTGAGDAFGAGFMAAIMSGKTTEEALKWGTCNSGSVLGFVGPEKGLLTKDQMPEWLKKAENVRVGKI